MKITILRSSFQNDEFVWNEYTEIINRLKNECQAEFQIIGEDSPAVETFLETSPQTVMVATGGVENLFKTLFQKERFQETSIQKVTLIADGRNNSLAAALEILTWLESQGLEGRIVHGTNDEIIETLRETLMEQETFQETSLRGLLRGTRIGVFGQPSDWLIASDVDQEYLMEHFGVMTVDIDLQRVVEGIKAVPQAEAVKVSQQVVKRSQGIQEPGCADMMEAAKTYIAIKKICQEERLNALTIRCFDIVKACGTTSCLALALLNDEGIVAGCEGDMQTLMSMLLARKVCGEAAFMANPSKLTDETSLFAHCTIPLNMCDTHILRSHFESSLGVAIQGVMPQRYYTVFKWGGRRLDRWFVAEAEAVETPYSEHFCRTQLTLKLNMKPYLLNHPIGNHHVIISGKHQKEMARVINSECGMRNAE